MRLCCYHFGVHIGDIIMKKVVTNPYLPNFEYVPDGEPHVFNGRVYVYGSHDRFGGKGFCLNDYITWSAPIDDLSDWRYEGVIWKKTDDPLNKKKHNSMPLTSARAQMVNIIFIIHQHLLSQKVLGSSAALLQIVQPVHSNSMAKSI